jgi:general secretion pathway protein L
MAHVVAGIDLGAHAVKFVLIEVGFRVSRLVSSWSELVPPGEAPLAERQGEALQAGMARLPGETMTYLALPGEMLAVRALDLPFADARKIDQVVGFELEGQIVHSLQDVVFDHVTLKPSGGLGATVLAVAARTEEVGELLSTLAGRGLDPRGLYAAPVIYHTLFAGAARQPGAAEPGCRLLVDVGHRRTNVCFILRDETVYARTITRGGEALTAAVAEAFKLGPVEAERAKHEVGFLSGPDRPAPNATAERMDAALRGALTPLLRELRQTVASFRARDKTPIEGVLLTGGGAALNGLAAMLEEELGAPVSIFAPDSEARAGDPGEAELGAPYTLGAAIAWAGARGGKELDLRRGPFQFKASFSVLRQKAVHVGMLVAALLVCATIDATMALARLNKQRDQLQAQLRVATQELFGEPRMDAKAVATLLKRGFKEEMAPIPKATAYDLMSEISRRLPAADKIKLDITQLDIAPKKAAIRGTVDSAAARDEMVTKLSEIDCFENISKGPISELSDGTKQFVLNINSKCP